MSKKEKDISCPTERNNLNLFRYLDQNEIYQPKCHLKDVKCYLHQNRSLFIIIKKYELSANTLKRL